MQHGSSYVLLDGILKEGVGGAEGRIRSVWCMSLQGCIWWLLSEEVWGGEKEMGCENVLDVYSRSKRGMKMKRELEGR